jgi:hypothetical protein
VQALTEALTEALVEHDRRGGRVNPCRLGQDAVEIE